MVGRQGFHFVCGVWNSNFYALLVWLEVCDRVHAVCLVGPVYRIIGRADCLPCLDLDAFKRDYDDAQDPSLFGPGPCDTFYTTLLLTVSFK